MPRRGSTDRPQNRFERVAVDGEDSNESDVVRLETERIANAPRTEFLFDKSRSIVSTNDSPDIHFNYSINPYRGCEHGCSYCYARPTHEYLGFDAGLDFESKIVVKLEAAELFRKWLGRAPHRRADGGVEAVVMSGVTDCYQPCERRFRLTRSCLEVASACGQPMSLITKNALVTRDLDVLADMAARRLVRVGVSVTTLDAPLARRMEPRTSTPAARLRAIQELTDAGVPVHAMIAPVIPGLNDSEVPALLEAVADHGAVTAGHVLLRLPLNVEPVFRLWLSREEPTKAAAVESAVRSTRDGAYYSSTWGERQRGTGLRAEQITRTFGVFARRYGLDGTLPPMDSHRFVRPDESGQLALFAGS